MKKHIFKTAPTGEAWGPSFGFLAALSSGTFAKTQKFMRFMAKQTTEHRAAAKRGEIR